MKGQDATLKIIDTLVPASDADKFGKIKESKSPLKAILKPVMKAKKSAMKKGI